MLRASRLLNIAINSVNADFKLHRAFTKSMRVCDRGSRTPAGPRTAANDPPEPRVIPLLTRANNLP